VEDMGKDWSGFGTRRRGCDDNELGALALAANPAGFGGRAVHDHRLMAGSPAGLGEAPVRRLRVVLIPKGCQPLAGGRVQRDPRNWIVFTSTNPVGSQICHPSRVDDANYAFSPGASLRSAPG
jgi:hypothetical protein